MVIGMVTNCAMATIYYFKKFLNVGFKFPLSPKENFIFFSKKKKCKVGKNFNLFEHLGPVL